MRLTIPRRAKYALFFIVSRDSACKFNNFKLQNGYCNRNIS